MTNSRLHLSSPSPDYAAAGDFLRVFCVFMIGWYHIWQQSWLTPVLALENFRLDVYPYVRAGYMFVDLMLLLSGFLLYLPYANGKKVGEQNAPVSNVGQFLLVSTEPRGYRKVGNDGGLSDGRRAWGKPDPALFDAVLPDFFEVDFVRVFDEVPS